MEFLRYVFLIGTLVGSTSIGFLLSKSFTERLKELKNLQKLIKIMQDKIKFTHKPLSEIFEETALTEKTKISQIFIKTSEKIKNMSTQDAWNEAILEERFFLNLKNDDIELIKSFGNMLGKTDVEGQMSEINQFINLLDGQIIIAEKESMKNSKMYKSLGTIVGLGIVTILF